MSLEIIGPGNSNTPSSPSDYVLNGGKSASLVGGGERKLINYLTLLDKEGALAKQSAFEGVDLFQDIYRGKQWPSKMPKHKIPAVINMVQQLVERKAALMTDTRPVIKIIPTIYNATKQVEIRKHVENASQALQGAVDGIWFEKKFELKFARAIVIAEILGGVGFNTINNLSLGRGGDIDLLVLDPRSIKFDPFVVESERIRDGQYVITDEVMATDYLKSIYHSSCDKILPDKGYMMGTNEGEGGIRSKIAKLFGFGGNAYSFNGVNRSTVKNYWLKDYTDMDMDGKRVPMYPGGRHIVRIGDRIIIDEPNPYIDGEMPIDYLDWHLDINSPWGFGDVELYKQPQEIFNKLLATIVENAVLSTNSIWIGDEDAMAPKEWGKLSNVPGSYVKKRRGRDLRRDAPPPMSAGAFQTLSFIMGGIDKLSGVMDAVSGQAPGQVTSGVALENLQVAAQTIIRLKSRHMETIQGSIGQKLISRIFQFIPSNRVFTITGDAGQMMAYQFERKRIKNDVIKSFRDFKFQIQPGSSLASTKSQRGMVAIQLFSLNMIDKKAALDALEYPDREDIMERMAKAEQAMMEQQLMMAQGNGQPQGASPSMHPASRGGRGSVPRSLPKAASTDLGQRTVPGANIPPP